MQTPYGQDDTAFQAIQYPGRSGGFRVEGDRRAKGWLAFHARGPMGATLLILIVISSAKAALSQVTLYPDCSKYGTTTLTYPRLQPPGDKVAVSNGFQQASEFTVTVNGTTVPVYNAWNGSTDNINLISAKTLKAFASLNGVVDYWGTFRLCTFAFTGTVNVQVHYSAKDSKKNLIPINSFEISPQSNGIQATATLDKATNTISFSMPSLANNVSQKLEIRINPSSDSNSTEMRNNAGAFLYILADPPESYPNMPPHPVQPKSKSGGLLPLYIGDMIYFGPGVYTPPVTPQLGGDPLWAQTISISNTTKIGTPPTTVNRLYLAPGAILNANIELSGRTKPFHIYGHGFLQNPYTGVQKAAAKKARDNGTKDTTSSPSNPYALEINGSSAPILVEDINLINSVMYNILFDGSSNSVVQNVKCLHSCVNSDGISFYGANTNKVLNSLIANNDNQIVIGSTNESAPVTNDEPMSNVVQGCTFICVNGDAGHWLYPQGNDPIGPGNVIRNCDVVRTSTNPPITQQWYFPSAVADLVVDTIRFQRTPGDFNCSSYFDLNPVPQGQLNSQQRTNWTKQLGNISNKLSRTISLQNLDLPALPSGVPRVAALDTYGLTANMKWTFIFNNVSMHGNLLNSDTSWGLQKNVQPYPSPVTTSYSSGFTTWQSTSFGGSDIQPSSVPAKQSGNPAGDGISNLLKYALNMDPTVNAYASGSSSLPVVQIEPILNPTTGLDDDYLTLSFTAGFAPDLTYTVEATSDPSGPWTPLSTFPGNSIMGASEVVVDNQPANSYQKRFMRLRVTQNPKN